MSNIPVNTSAVAGVMLSEPGGLGRMLLLKRKQESYWCFVAGHLREGETAVQAITREFREETGMETGDLYSADYVDAFYEPARGHIRLVPVFVAYHAPGQAPALNEEHTDWKWCSLDEARQLAPYPNQHRVFEHIWEHFIAHTPNPALLVRD